MEESLRKVEGALSSAAASFGVKDYAQRWKVAVETGDPDAEAVRQDRHMTHEKLLRYVVYVGMLSAGS